MGSPHDLAREALKRVCARYESKAADLQSLVESAVSFEDWLAFEAYLACKPQQGVVPFREVEALPTYGSEGLKDDEGRPDATRGGLRIGDATDPDDHRWLFAEFVVLLESNRKDDGWPRAIESAIARLRRLQWKRSVSMLVLVTGSSGMLRAEWNQALAELAVGKWPLLIEPFALELPGGGSFMLKATDIKRDPANVIAQ